MNLTLSIDSQLLKDARKAAVEKDTTVNALVRDYLSDLVKKQQEDKTAFLSEWKKLMDRNPVDMSTRIWTREELHER